MLSNLADSFLREGERLRLDRLQAPRAVRGGPGQDDPDRASALSPRHDCRKRSMARAALGAPSAVRARACPPRWSSGVGGMTYSNWAHAHAVLDLAHLHRVEEREDAVRMLSRVGADAGPGRTPFLCRPAEARAIAGTPRARRRRPRPRRWTTARLARLVSSGSAPTASGAASGQAFFGPTCRCRPGRACVQLSRLSALVAGWANDSGSGFDPFLFAMDGVLSVELYWGLSKRRNAVRSLAPRSHRYRVPAKTRETPAYRRRPRPDAGQASTCLRIGLVALADSPAAAVLVCPTRRRSHTLGFERRTSPRPLLFSPRALLGQVVLPYHSVQGAACRCRGHPRPPSCCPCGAGAFGRLRLADSPRASFPGARQLGGRFRVRIAFVGRGDKGRAGPGGGPCLTGSTPAARPRVPCRKTPTQLPPSNRASAEPRARPVLELAHVAGQGWFEHAGLGCGRKALDLVSRTCRRNRLSIVVASIRMSSSRRAAGEP